MNKRNFIKILLGSLGSFFLVPKGAKAEESPCCHEHNELVFVDGKLMFRPEDYVIGENGVIKFSKIMEPFLGDRVTVVNFNTGKVARTLILGTKKEIKI